MKKYEVSFGGESVIYTVTDPDTDQSNNERLKARVDELLDGRGVDILEIRRGCRPTVIFERSGALRFFEEGENGHSSKDFRCDSWKNLSHEEIEFFNSVLDEYENPTDGVK